MSTAWKLVEAVEQQEVEQVFEPQHDASAGDHDENKRFERRGGKSIAIPMEAFNFSSN